MTQVVVDPRELVRRALKYVAEGLMVAIAAQVLPKKKLDLEEVVMLACVSAATFALLDMFGGDQVSMATRQGVGFGLGANLVGFPAR